MAEKIEDALLKQNLVSADRMDEIREEHKRSGEPIGKLLLKKGYVREEDLVRALAEQFRIPFVRFAKFVIAKDVTDKVPAKLAYHYKMVPVKFADGVLTVAISDPQDIRILDDIRMALKSQYRIEAVLATETDIMVAIKKYYGLGAETVESMVARDEEKIPSPTMVGVPQEIDDIEKLAGDASIVKLVNQVLLEAWKKRATDIHVEPYRQKLQLRYRVDGILYPAEVPDQIRKFLPAIISRIKIMSNLNIVERRLPQDGRTSVKVGAQKMDLRISILPTPHGESVVIRILPTSMLLRLSDLGLDDTHLKILADLIEKPHGIIFVTGPTGSGKSTTLYTCLSTVNTPERKIITIEDPVEYELEGITQIQVNPQIGLTFAQGLRSMLRHDPDVMMVGEVRDSETAELAIRIALTGHMVLSTLHTNDSAGAVTRLLDMGIDPFLVASSVECFIAQRLIRKICAHCKVEDKREISKEILKEMRESRKNFPEEPKIWTGQGCEECNSTGYKGRTGIHEFLVVNSAIKELIMNKSTADEILRAGLKNGMRTLRQVGWDKVLEGVTSLDEVLRVTQIGADEG